LNKSGLDQAQEQKRTPAKGREVAARCREKGEFNYAPDRKKHSSSLSDLGNRSEKVAERGQILLIFCVNSGTIDQKISEIWTAQALLQPILPKSDRLLGFAL
jgi:hypothetical protein